MRTYARRYSPVRFWNVMARHAGRLGRTGAEKALWLYYALQAPETPAWARAKIVGALGYLLFPLDAVPDVVPGGFADDLGVLAWALAAVAVHVTPEVKAQARATLEGWFGA